jgi:hypothetical protein
MDNIIDLSKKLKASLRSQQRIDVSGEVSNVGFVKTYRKHRVQIDFYSTFISVTINANSILALAINNPDLMFGFKVPIQNGKFPYPVYVSDNAEKFFEDENIRGFLIGVFGLLQALEFSDFESAYFYRNGMRFVLSPERDIKAVLDSLIDLIDKHRIVFSAKSKTSISRKNLPENLRLLFPFLKKYAIADDTKRSLLIESISTKEKEELVNIVSPLFHDINSYLSSFEGRTLSEEAILVGNLAELVTELITLSIRS